MPKLVFASTNSGKLNELAQLLPHYRILGQSEFHCPEVAETGLTFVENALLKARSACAHARLPAIADDSGLMIDALNGAPGLYSARFAGPEANFTDNIEKVLRLLKNTSNRTARFYACVVLLQHAHDPAPLIAFGTWEGSILHKPTGTHGFGYDPIFFVPEHNCSAAELSFELKNTLSHRAKAVTQLKQQLR